MCKVVNLSHPAGDGVCVHIRCDLMGLINHPDCRVLVKMHSIQEKAIQNNQLCHMTPSLNLNTTPLLSSATMFFHRNT